MTSSAPTEPTSNLDFDRILLPITKDLPARSTISTRFTTCYGSFPLAYNVLLRTRDEQREKNRRMDPVEHLICMYPALHFIKPRTGRRYSKRDPQGGQQTLLTTCSHALWVDAYPTCSPHAPFHHRTRVAFGLDVLVTTRRNEPPWLCHIGTVCCSLYGVHGLPNFPFPLPPCTVDPSRSPRMLRVTRTDTSTAQPRVARADLRPNQRRCILSCWSLYEPSRTQVSLDE